MNFKKSGVIISILIISFLTAGIFNSGCYLSDDETRVTIRLQRNDLGMNYYIPEKRMIDRVLEFFSTPSYAFFGWNSVIGDLTLKVRSSSFNEIIFEIPSDATSYTVVVPAVSNVTFEITSLITEGETGDVPQNWGGHTTVSLSPGEQEISISMIPMTKITFVSGSTHLTVNWIIDNIPAYVTSYNVYRSDTEAGPYGYKGLSGTSSFDDFDVDYGRTYYYRVSTVSTYGEGVMSDPVSGTSE
jgi:hypothetical protein